MEEKYDKNVNYNLGNSYKGSSKNLIPSINPLSLYICVYIHIHEYIINHIVIINNYIFIIRINMIDVIIITSIKSLAYMNMCILFI